MVIMNLLTANHSNSTNFRNLALLICHLFIGGQFRQGHILYDPKVFDGHLTTEIDSVCPVQIPWQLTDITRPSPTSPTNGDHTIRTDHILQLILLDPKYLAEQIDEYKEYFTIYRIFMLSSTTDTVETTKRFSIIGKSNLISDSNALVVIYNPNNIIACLTSQHAEKNVCMDYESVNVANEQELFGQMFGVYEQTRSVEINFPLIFWRIEDYKNLKASIPTAGSLYFANYFSSALNASYMNINCQGLDNSTEHKIQILKHKQRKYHNELALQYEEMDNGRLNELVKQETDTLFLTSFSLSPQNNKKTSTHSLYPYQFEKVMVIFIYGADFQRQLNIWINPGSGHTVLVLIGTFVCLATVILLVIRKKSKLDRNSLMPSLIDTMVAFISGGNLRMRHKWERWFFGILLIGAFFITSLFTGDLLDRIMTILNHKMKRLEQLADLPSPIYVHSTLVNDVEHIQNILRREIGPNINFNGVKSIRQLINNYENSFIYVGKFYSMEVFTTSLMDHHRDFDVLEENLGGLPAHYTLQGNRFVPDRTLKVIDTITSTMMENGLFRFYSSFVAFQRNFFERAHLNQNDDDDDIRALTIEQMKKPMILVFCLCGIATIVFIVEIFVHKLRNRNQSR